VFQYYKVIIIYECASVYTVSLSPVHTRGGLCSIGLVRPRW